MKTDISPVAVDLYFIPTEMRIPLKFGPEITTSVICARACVTVENEQGKTAQGWGETPLSVQWTWPSSLGYQERCDAMLRFCRMLAEAWVRFDLRGHPIELGSGFIESVLPGLLEQLNAERGEQAEPMPHLAALVCCSLFDIAVHDAYGNLLGRDVYSTYSAEFMNRDLSYYVEPAEGCDISFEGKYPADFFNVPPAKAMPAWHLVGGKDLLDASELTGEEPDDGYPVLLPDWVKRDGLTCLKVKLCGNDSAWDYERLIRVGEIAINNNVVWLTSDFNCTVTDPAYVNDILDRLMTEFPGIYQMILYVEQPFPYDLEQNQIDVHSVSARKPLFMDESAHDWRLIRLGPPLGLDRRRTENLQDSNRGVAELMLGQSARHDPDGSGSNQSDAGDTPHVRLAAHAGTIMGVETNSMQFYPAASEAEEKVHPGLYKRRDGKVDLSTLSGPGFGYRLDEIKRQLPELAAHFEK